MDFKKCSKCGTKVRADIDVCPTCASFSFVPMAAGTPSSGAGQGVPNSNRPPQYQGNAPAGRTGAPVGFNSGGAPASPLNMNQTSRPMVPAPQRPTPPTQRPVPPAPKPNYIPNQPPLQPQKPKSGSGKKWWIIGGIAAFVILLTVIMVIALSGGSDTDSGNGNDSSYTDPNGDYSYPDISLPDVSVPDYSTPVFEDDSTPSTSTTPDESNGDIGGDSTPSGAKNMTVMIYIIGSNLESDLPPYGGAATMDLVEMVNSGVDLDKNNVVIYTGGANRWEASSIPTDTNYGWLLTEGDIQPIKDFGAKSMVKSETLAEFISFSVANYPAREYSLILWDHGGGPIHGYGHDEANGGNDYMDMSEICNALKSSGISSTNKLEFIGFDACLMGTVEVAWCLRDYADYMIASQEVEPGAGWDYVFLNTLNSTNDGDVIGKAIIDSYFEFYESSFAMGNWYTELTLSCIDLSKMDALENGLVGLLSDINGTIDGAAFSKISRDMQSVRLFGKSSDSRSYDLFDVAHFLSFVSADYGKASVVQSALKDAVAYSKTNISNADGLSFYHPYYAKDSARYYVEILNAYGLPSDHIGYLNSFAQSVARPSDRSWSDFGSSVGQTTVVGSENELTIQLTEEQAESYASGAYYVLKRIKDNEYMFVFAGFDVKLGEDGVLSASYDNKAVFAKNDTTGEYTEAPIPLVQLRDGSNCNYYAPALFWLFGDDIADWRTEAVEWHLSINGDVVTPKTAYIIPDADELFPKKQTLNYKDFDTIGFTTSSRIPTKDSDGNLLPYFQWESSDWYYSYELEAADGISFECRELENTDDYFVMFVVNDIQGNSFCSGMCELSE